jgi:3-phosphoshikimate 1-carboxyvinyltransferase
MTQLRITPQPRPLSGVVTVPSDKSISHRAIMLAALADGRSRVDNWLPAGDTLATLELFRALGVPIAVEQTAAYSWRLTIDGRGLHGLDAPQAPLDCRNAGTCMRLTAGILAGQPFPAILDGSAQLRRRPMGRITGPLRQMGANIQDNDGRAPLHIFPARLQGIELRLPVASAQVKSALLLAGLYAHGPTRIYQPGPARDHTERMLQAAGVQVAIEAAPFGVAHDAPSGGQWLTLTPPVEALRPFHLTVPGDMSSAAFPLVAAALVPDSQVTIQNVGQNETRTGLLDLLTSMGADIIAGNGRQTGGEPAADLTVRCSQLRGAQAGGSLVVRAIDEFPIWAVAATQAVGTSQVEEATELRVKEVDRISILAGELRKMGAAVTEQPDGFMVDGPSRLRGAVVDSHGDHRLGMALAVAGLVADGPTLIQDAACIADSFPGFVETMNQLGATMTWVA